MARRHLYALLLMTFGLTAGTGCQQSAPTARYVEPRFDGPQLAQARQPVAAPAPPPVAVVPPAPRPKTRPIVPSAVAAVPQSWLPPTTPRPWRWIVIHHSDTEHGGLAFIDRLHKDKGWDGVGYDFVIGNGTDTGDGQVEPTFRWREQIIGAHAKTPDNRFNEYGIGICLVGDMMQHPPTPKQMAAVERLTAYLMATYHIAPDHILGHRDTKSTECPGRYTSLPAIRLAATKQAGGLAAIAGTSYPQPTGEMLVSTSAVAR